MGTVIVVGNPKLGSRTRQAAELLAARLTGAPASAVIEVADLGPGLLTWGDPMVAAAKETVKLASLLIVASPTYKAAYTGLLKLFLDQFGAGELIGVTAIPLDRAHRPRHPVHPGALRPGAGRIVRHPARRGAAARTGAGIAAAAGAHRDRLQLPAARAVSARLAILRQPRAVHLAAEGAGRSPGSFRYAIARLTGRAVPATGTGRVANRPVPGRRKLPLGLSVAACRRRSYWAFHAGSRFSMNARGPSFASSVAATRRRWLSASTSAS